MAKNLNYVSPDSSWCYDDLNSNCDTYGRLYTWDVAMGGAAKSNKNPSGIQGICPNGWHLPSDPEWEELQTFVNDDVATLMASHTWEMLESDDSTLTFVQGTDDYAFSALPGGWRLSNGLYRSEPSFGYWWGSSQDQIASNGMYWSMGSVNSALFNNFQTKPFGLSVRCVMD